MHVYASTTHIACLGCARKPAPPPHPPNPRSPPRKHPTCLVQHHAIATFNVLNAEERPVVAALLSSLPVHREEASFYTADGTPPPVSGTPQ
jgi:hypothetical protein